MLAMMEIVLRMFPLPLPDRFFEPNQDFGWFHIPTRQGWQATREFRVWISINRLGLRDTEHTYEKPAHVYRILLLGDSFTEALQVPLQDTLGKRLESAYNANRKSERQYEVINGGVSRFGTDNELLFYQYEGARYRPDLVILFFYHNDVTDNVERPYFTLLDDRVSAVEPKPTEVLSPGDNVRGWLWDHFQTCRLGVIGMNVIASLVGLDQPPVEHRSKELYRREYSQEMEDAWSLTGALIKEVELSVTADGAQFVVVGISDIAALEPSTPEEELDWARPNWELERHLAESGIPYIDLLSTFQSHYALTGELLYWPDDQHWNAAGHRLAANTVCTELSKMDILECQPSNNQ